MNNETKPDEKATKKEEKLEKGLETQQQSLTGDPVPGVPGDIGNYDPKKAKDDIKPPKDKDIRTA